MLTTHAVRLACITILCLCAFLAGNSVENAPIFLKPPATTLTYTERDITSMTITMPEGESKATVNLLTRKTLSPAAEGFVLDITVQSLEIAGAEYQPTTYAPAQLQGMHYQLDVTPTGTITGYHDELTPEAWLRAKMPAAIVEKMMANADEWEFLRNICVKHQLNHLTFGGRPAVTGARWFALDINSGGANGAPLTFYTATTVGKPATVGAVKCLKVETTANTDVKGLAKSMKCKTEEILGALPPIAPSPPRPDDPKIVGVGKDVLLIDPATLRLYTFEGQRVVDIDIPLEAEKGKKPEILHIKMTVREQQTLTYDG